MEAPVLSTSLARKPKVTAFLMFGAQSRVFSQLSEVALFSLLFAIEKNLIIKVLHIQLYYSEFYHFFLINTT